MHLMSAKRSRLVIIDFQARLMPAIHDGPRLVANAAKLVAAAKLDGNVAYAQRLGWLLEKSAFAAKVVRLARWVSGQKPLPAKLEPSVPLRGSIRAKRWNLWINSEVEGDLA